MSVREPTNLNNTRLNIYSPSFLIKTSCWPVAATLLKASPPENHKIQALWHQTDFVIHADSAGDDNMAINHICCVTHWQKTMFESDYQTWRLPERWDWWFSRIYWWLPEKTEEERTTTTAFTVQQHQCKCIRGQCVINAKTCH